MTKLKTALAWTFLLAGAAAGCSPYCVDASLEGINYFVQHPSRYCFYCPFANPRCPYYDYDVCDWAAVAAQPTISALNAPPVVVQPDQMIVK